MGQVLVNKGALSCAYPQISCCIFTDGIDPVINEKAIIFEIVSEDLEFISVIAV